MYCNSCESNPCTCQKSLAPIPAPVNWLIHACTTPGCSVTIRVPVGEQHRHGQCKWCRGQQAYNTRNPTATLASTGPLLSRDEFGQALFAEIKAQAGAIQALKTADSYTAKGFTDQAKEYQDHAKALQHELEVILRTNTVAPNDVRRILAMA